MSPRARCIVQDLVVVGALLQSRARGAVLVFRDASSWGRQARNAFLKKQRCARSDRSMRFDLVSTGLS